MSDPFHSCKSSCTGSSGGSCGSRFSSCSNGAGTSGCSGCSSLSGDIYTVSVKRSSAASGCCPQSPRVTSLPISPESGRCSGGSWENDRDAGSCGCCKASFREALRLLCSCQLSELVDFNKFAFLTSSTLVGTQLEIMAQQPGPQDDLGILSGSFRRFSPGTCDLIDIGGIASNASSFLMPVSQASLCTLTALVFESKEAASAEGGYTQEEITQYRFRQARDLIQCQLEPVDPCGTCICDCRCTDDCCCADSVLDSLSGSSLNKQANWWPVSSPFGMCPCWVPLARYSSWPTSPPGGSTLSAPTKWNSSPEPPASLHAKSPHPKTGAYIRFIGPERE